MTLIMKKIEFFLIVAAVMAVSCNKSAVSTPAAQNDGKMATLTVNVCDAVTKAASTYLTHNSNEKRLESEFEIIAFNKDNSGNPTTVSSWYRVAEVGSANSFTTTLYPGDDIPMVFFCNQSEVNPQVAGTFANLSKVTTDTRVAFTENHLPLGLGVLSPYILDIPAGSNLEVNVSLLHMCSRIVLKSVVNEMTDDDRIESFTAMSVTLLNVPKGMKMDGTVVDEPYYNPLGGDYSTAELCAATTAKGAGPRSFGSITHNSPTTILPTCVYTYPGSNVYLMLKAEVLVKSAPSVQNYYYAVPLEDLEYNKTYDVSLHIRNLGSLDPEDPAITSKSSFTISVANWTAGEEIDELM